MLFSWMKINMNNDKQFFLYPSYFLRYFYSSSENSDNSFTRLILQRIEYLNWKCQTLWAFLWLFYVLLKKGENFIWSLSFWLKLMNIPFWYHLIHFLKLKKESDFRSFEFLKKNCQSACNLSNVLFCYLKNYIFHKVLKKYKNNTWFYLV